MHADAAAAVIGSKVIQFLSEEVAETPLAKRNGSAVFSGGTEAAKRRRSLLSALQLHASPLLSLLITAASAYMQSSLSSTTQGDTMGAEKNHSAVRAGLEALAALSSWLPLKALKESQLLDVCSSLLQSPPLQQHAVEVLTQVLLPDDSFGIAQAHLHVGLFACTVLSCAGLLQPRIRRRLALMHADLQPEQQTSKPRWRGLHSIVHESCIYSGGCSASSCPH